MGDYEAEGVRAEGGEEREEVGACGEAVGAQEEGVRWGAEREELVASGVEERE